MVNHVALQKLPSNLTELWPQRSRTSAYANTAEATAAQPQDPVQQQRELPGNLPPVDPKVLEKAIKDLSQGVQNQQRSLQFSVDESSGRIVVKILDKATQEVIRQIPEQEVLDLAARLDAGSGLFVKDEA